MKVGLQLVNFGFPGGPRGTAQALAGIARRAEEAGFSSLWTTDHLFQIPFVGPPESDTLEAFTLLGYLAAITRRMELGTLVAAVTFRHPGILIKTVTTLDVLSGGRAWLGLGAGWFEREHRGLGIPLPSLGVRMARLEETLQIAHRMWSADDGPYTGEHFQLAETLCRPLPLSRPRPPIMIGGGGERQTLRLAARYASACNLLRYVGRDALKHKLAVLRAHCEAEGRDFASLGKSVLLSLKLRPHFEGPGSKSIEELLEELHLMAELGFDTVLFNCLYAHVPGAFDSIAERIIPAVAGV
ncbi:MAG: LLM class F420-dependent oxidoreductase [Armatimonadetes bacterium]|nr:LLM class F420-dependent oxidoreductase [Armatimonadota bacterium]